MLQLVAVVKVFLRVCKTRPVRKELRVGSSPLMTTHAYLPIFACGKNALEAIVPALSG